jgi:hypothetical protein
MPGFDDESLRDVVIVLDDRNSSKLRGLPVTRSFFYRSISISVSCFFCCLRPCCVSSK